MDSQTAIKGPAFREAKQNKVFEDVVDQIENAILDGNLKAGDRLPAERELVKLFGTSRGTLREALRVLEQKGLIEIKLGVHGGAMVKSVTAEPVAESLALLIRHERVSLKHLAEFREGLEANVAELAAARVTENDKEELAGLIDDARAALDLLPDHWEEFILVDERFHTTLGRIAGNPVYIWILETIHDNIHRYYQRHLPRSRPVFEENFTDLSEIAEAVTAGNGQRARELAADHVKRFSRHMGEKMLGAS